jgi:hypothetical protein
MIEKDIREVCNVLAAYIFPLNTVKLVGRLPCSYDENEITIDRCIIAMHGAFAEIVRNQPTVATVTTLLMVSRCGLL